MKPEIVDLWNVIKELIKDIAIYIMPIVATFISCKALKHSNDAIKVRVQLSEVEQKLNECELALKKYKLEQIEESKKKTAIIEARIIKISDGNYRMKIWNSGNTVAYSVNASIPEKYNIIVLNQKMPYEYLEPNKNFDEHVVIHMQSSRKFEVILTWKDEKGNEFSKTQLSSY